MSELRSFVVDMTIATKNNNASYKRLMDFIFIMDRNHYPVSKLRYLCEKYKRIIHAEKVKARKVKRKQNESSKKM